MFVSSKKIHILDRSIREVDKKHAYLDEVDLVKNGALFLFYYKQDGHYSIIPDNFKLAHNPKLVNNLDKHTAPKWEDIVSFFIANNDIVKDNFRVRASYLFKILSSFCERFKNDFHIIDVGASYGIISLLMAAMLKELKYDKKIYAFEPGVTNKLVKKNFELNHMDQEIELLPYAVGKFNNYSVMYYDLGQSQDNRLVNPLPTTLSKPVKVIRLDDFLEKSSSGIIPAFIKIDTQGYEPFVFDGLEKIFAKKIPCVIETEFTPWCLETELFRDMGAVGFLKQLISNFRIFHHDLATGYVEIKDEDISNFVKKISDKEPCWTDILCVSHHFPEADKLLKSIIR